MPFSRIRTTSTACLPDWYESYFAAVLEADEAKALARMELASKAMQARLLDLMRSGSDETPEMQDIHSASIYLRLLSENICAEKRSFHDSNNG